MSTDAGRTALVTGGAGFIGSHVARTLLERGWSVRVLDNLSTGFRDAVPPGASFVEGDLRDPGTVNEACKDVEVIFHIAAMRSVPRSVDDPFTSAEVNVMGTLNVLRGAEAAGVRRVVNSSSSSVYGGAKLDLNQESDPINPQSPYAASKASAELYCRVWTALKGLSTVSLRYFNVYGPGQPAESTYAAVFPAFIRAFKQGVAAEIHWDGEQSRDFSYIDDVVESNILAAQASDVVDGRALNIGGGGAKTVNEVHATIAKSFDSWIEPVYAPKRKGDVRATRADISLAEELIGWKPRAEWISAVEATVSGFVER